MQDYQRRFIQFALDYDVLRFGDFTTKSGRQSPYFFNIGLFNSGQALLELGRCYAAAIADANVDYQMMFGPAYKGIALVCAAAMALAERGQDVPYCFNRKEVKDHGEGGQIVGSPLQGQVLLLDDVITAGTAIRESMVLLEQAEAQLAGVVIAFDRQERGQGDKSAIAEVEEKYGVPVISLVKLEHLVTFLQEQGGYAEHLAKIEKYREQYGV